MQTLKESVMAKHLLQFMLALFIIGGTTAGMTGCEQDSGLENAGESIDEGIEEADDEIDDNT